MTRLRVTIRYATDDVYDIYAATLMIRDDATMSIRDPHACCRLMMSPRLPTPFDYDARRYAITCERLRYCRGDVCWCRCVDAV